MARAQTHIDDITADLLTCDEAAKILRLPERGSRNPRRTLVRLRDKGCIRSVRVGQSLLFSKSSIENWLRQKLAG